MYSLQQSNELENHIPRIPCQPDQILNDLLTPENTTDLLPIGKKHRRSPTEIQENRNPKGITITTDTNEHNKLKRRIMRRDIERRRRQEMANLYASLRSHLPLEYIKGKRAVSDYMQEAVNYIKCLQKNISQLRVQRDSLMFNTRNLRYNFCYGNESGSAERFCSGDHASVTVSQGRDGVEVLVSVSPKGETFPISRVLKRLIGEGLDVVSCVSTTTDDIKVHKILAKVTDDQKSIDILELQQLIKSM